MALKSIELKGEQKKVLFFPVTNPIQIKGVVGSGKTTIAMYRAKHLLDTYSDLFIEYLTGNVADKVKGATNKKSALNIAYVAMSRPAHFLCAAFHKDRIPNTMHEWLE